MAKQERRRYDTSFKEKVVLEALREQKTLSQIAGEYGIHANQVSQWKQQALSGLSLSLSGKIAKREKDTAIEEIVFFEQIGRLQMENACLKKKLEKLQKGGH